MLQWIVRLFLRRKANPHKVKRGRERSPMTSRDSFRFSPDLFQIRLDVIAQLNERNFDWLTHYSSVDPAHDVHGIEVCGIRHHEDAKEILALLKEMFPHWHPACLCYYDCGAEPGFTARVGRDRDQLEEHWETVD